MTKFRAVFHALATLHYRRSLASARSALTSFFHRNGNGILHSLLGGPPSFLPNHGANDSKLHRRVRRPRPCPLARPLVPPPILPRLGGFREGVLFMVPGNIYATWPFRRRTAAGQAAVARRTCVNPAQNAPSISPRWLRCKSTHVQGK